MEYALHKNEIDDCIKISSIIEKCVQKVVLFYDMVLTVLKYSNTN